MTGVKVTNSKMDYIVREALGRPFALHIDVQALDFLI